MQNKSDICISICKDQALNFETQIPYLSHRSEKQPLAAVKHFMDQ